MRAQREEPEIIPWGRKRGFWALYGGDLLMLVTALFFLGLTISLIAFVLIKPKVPGLSELFSDTPPPPQIQQKLHLQPGEQEIILFDNNKPKALPGGQQQPQTPQQKR
jgi:hypothetical protein